MTKETWEQEYKRERAERSAKAKKAYAVYRADKTKKLVEKSRDKRGKDTTYVYEDWVKETDEVRRVKTTTFRVQDDGTLYMFQNTSKSQKFLCANGPLAGLRITDTNEEYVLYNCAGFAGTAPKCVLVHRSSFE